jgi:dTDP-glucose 4,6-dehydratase
MRGIEMTTLLVTGGCGFIGSNFIRHLLSTDSSVQIVNMDALTYAGNLANLSDLNSHPRYQFVKGDITDREVVRAVMQQGITDIIHFAAESHVDRSIQDSGPFVRTNVLGTQILLDAAREFSVAKYVQVSTDEVYGSLGATGYFTEETPLHPNSPYSASKAGGDLLVLAYHHTFGIPAVITRCSNNYGPYQFPEKLIPLFVTNLLANQPVPVYGDGLQIRDWIHVLDHCRGVEAAWRRGRPGEVYNFGGRCEKTNLELTHLLLDLLEKPRSLIRFVPDRPGHDRRYAIDCTKAERELGWQPEISFDVGLKETIRWYQEQSAWVTAIKNKDYLQYYEKQYGKVA